MDADRNQLVIELREYWYMDFQKFQLENILDPHATLIHGINCHLQSDMILVHANKNEFVKSLDILRSLKKKGGGLSSLMSCSIPFFPIYAILLYKLYIQLEV